MHVLWLRYLTEIDEKTREVPQEFLDNPDIKKAVAQLEKSAFTDAQLRGYEKFWDTVSVEKTLINSAERKGRAEGIKQTARRMKAKGYPLADISDVTGLTIAEINLL